MGCICCGNSGKLQPIDAGCSLTRVPTIHGDEHKRRLVRVAIPAEGFQPTVHYDCVHNQVQSIRNRVIGVVPKPTSEGLVLMAKGAMGITHHLVSSHEDDIFALSKRHGGSKGARYHCATVEYLKFGLFKADSNVKMFIKPERFDPNAKINPDPRAIQFRNPKYCVAVARFLRPVEEQIYLFKYASDGVPNSRNVAKGLNAVARAMLLVEKASHFTEPVFITMDASRFDKHVSVQHLRLEHRVYLASNPDPEFASLLALQLSNTCFTSSGVKYKTLGRRMSGDMNTAIGNIIIMLTMIIAYCRYSLKLRTWDCLDDGDDFVLIVERGDVDRLYATAESVFLGFGMEMKVDPPAMGIHDVTFCQSKVVEFLPGKYKFVRDWRAIVSKSTSGVRNWENPTFRNNTINAVGLCELVINLGVPILQEYALALLRNTSSTSDARKYMPGYLVERTGKELKHLGIKSLRDVKPQSVHNCARRSFAEAYGISETEQVALEDRLRKWTFLMSTPVNGGDEWDAYSWTGTMSTSEVYCL